MIPPKGTTAREHAEALVHVRRLGRALEAAFMPIVLWIARRLP